VAARHQPVAAGEVHRLAAVELGERHKQTQQEKEKVSTCSAAT
jgi:hypothetical protein